MYRVSFGLRGRNVTARLDGPNFGQSLLLSVAVWLAAGIAFGTVSRRDESGKRFPIELEAVLKARRFPA